MIDTLPSTAFSPVYVSRIVISNPSLDAPQRRELLHDLELKHRQNTGDSNLLFKDEDIRRLRTRILMLRDENTSLQDQITLNEDSNATLSSQCDDLSAQLEGKMEVIHSLEKQLQKQEREYSSLKVNFFFPPFQLRRDGGRMGS